MDQETLLVALDAAGVLPSRFNAMPYSEWLEVAKQFVIRENKAEGNGYCLWNATFLSKCNTQQHDGGVQGGSDLRARARASYTFMHDPRMVLALKEDFLKDGRNDYDVGIYASWFGENQINCPFIILMIDDENGEQRFTESIGQVFLPEFWKNIPVEHMESINKGFLERAIVIVHKANHYDGLLFRNPAVKLAFVKDMIRMHQAERTCLGYAPDEASLAAEPDAYAIARISDYGKDFDQLQEDKIKQHMKDVGAWWRYWNDKHREFYYYSDHRQESQWPKYFKGKLPLYYHGDERSEAFGGCDMCLGTRAGMDALLATSARSRSAGAAGAAGAASAGSKRQIDDEALARQEEADLRAALAASAAEARIKALRERGTRKH